MPDNLTFEQMASTAETVVDEQREHLAVYWLFANWQKKYQEYKEAGERKERLEDKACQRKTLNTAALMGLMPGILIGAWLAGKWFLTDKLIGANDTAIMGAGFVLIVFIACMSSVVFHWLAKLAIWDLKKAATRTLAEFEKTAEEEFKNAMENYKQVAPQTAQQK